MHDWGDAFFFDEAEAGDRALSDHKDGEADPRGDRENYDRGQQALGMEKPNACRREPRHADLNEAEHRGSAKPRLWLWSMGAERRQRAAALG